MTLLARHTPQDAYRKVDFDARVSGCDPMELVAVCYEQLIAALGSALFAYERGDNHNKSKALTRALSALTALQLGVAGSEGVALALRQFYQSARGAVLDGVLTFDPQRINQVRQDFVDIAAALTAARPGS
ncbi:flagellar protein FliS [Novosphingobium flavum]|uniref:Flagellar protein FliS n=1 Tax=Novosphingobium flavum TaxID=1778672 RepID=A0A7X1KM52_9SPHN|nr:flagellar protein FliS [Novosphingobium flavum]MBC2665940.1 flagellar protein FliS [Novosphingobium flavum]